MARKPFLNQEQKDEIWRLFTTQHDNRCVKIGEQLGIPKNYVMKALDERLKKTK